MVKKWHLHGNNTQCNAHKQCLKLVVIKVNSNCQIQLFLRHYICVYLSWQKIEENAQTMSLCVCVMEGFLFLRFLLPRNGLWPICWFIFPEYYHSVIDRRSIDHTNSNICLEHGSWPIYFPDTNASGVRSLFSPLESPYYFSSSRAPFLRLFRTFYPYFAMAIQDTDNVNENLFDIPFI